MDKTSKTSRAIDAAKQPYAVMVWKGGYDNVTRLNFADPLEALLTGIGYLRRKYCVRLTDTACDVLEAMGPELERFLSPETAVPAARAATRKKAAARATEPPSGVVTVPAGDQPPIPAVVFSCPPPFAEVVEA